jgi:hypothetical protein
MTRPHSGTSLALLAAAAASLTAVPDAPAAKEGAPAAVEGRVRLPDGGIAEPEVQYAGYVDRIANPISELRPFDPRPECFVYLEGGPAGDDAAKVPARPVAWSLNSASFVALIVPVVLGSTVEIKNTGRGTHALYAEGQPDLLTPDPLGPGGTRTLAIKEPGKATIIRSKDSPHVEARVVALPTRYFATLKRDGTFSIPDVPPGKWTLKVWYKDGWLPVTKTIEVGGKDKDRVEIRLPDKLEPAGRKAAVK